MTEVNGMFEGSADQFESRGTKDIIFQNNDNIFMLGNKKDTDSFRQFINVLNG